MAERETYEQIVERRMNERARGIQKSIELWAKEKGIKTGEKPSDMPGPSKNAKNDHKGVIGSGETIKGNAKGHATERKQTKEEHAKENKR